MPFCTQCGTNLPDTAAFCRNCGAAQAAGATTGAGADWARPSGDPFRNVPPRTASVLCYVPWLGWIAAIAVLASQRFRDDNAVRFHAFQGLYLFVAWLLADWVLDEMLRFMPNHGLVTSPIKLAILLSWIFMLIKTSQNEAFRLPFIGDLADRSVTEQR